MATIELHLQMTIVSNEGTFLLRKEISKNDNINVTQGWESWDENKNYGYVIKFGIFLIFTYLTGSTDCCNLFGEKLFNIFNR